MTDLLAPPSAPTSADTSHHNGRVGADLLPTNQVVDETHKLSVGGGSSRSTATLDTSTTQQAPCCDLLDPDHVRHEPQLESVGVEPSVVDQDRVGAQFLYVDGSNSGWLEMRVWAEMFHDSQLTRIAAVNRAERGGVSLDIYAAHIERAHAAEHACRLELVRCYRRVVPAPVRAWQKDNLGLGEPLVARLLGHLGHPAIATPHHWEGTGTKRRLVADEPYERTLAQLWQYCGHGDAAKRIRKGITAEELAGLGSPMLKMLVHLNAEACMKQKSGSRYRDIYEHRRIITANRTHATDCVRCGPSGKPAPVGSPWSKAHQMADALRVVGKELLRDLWIAAAS